MLIREEDGDFKIILPEVPRKMPTREELNFIDVWFYKDTWENNGKVVPKKMNSDGREYIVLEMDVLRDTSIFRIVPYNTKDNVYIARVHVKEVVQSVKRDTGVQNVFYNDEGDLDLQENYVENRKREVSILGVTDVEVMYQSEVIQKMMERDLEKGLINELIKEAGDCEIALAVIKGESILRESD